MPRRSDDSVDEKYEQGFEKEELTRPRPTGTGAAKVEAISAAAVNTIEDRMI